MISLDNMAEWFRQRRNINATIKELHKLNDKELQDIGIHRSQIESVARNIVDFHREVRDRNGR